MQLYSFILIFSGSQDKLTSSNQQLSHINLELIRGSKKADMSLELEQYDPFEYNLRRQKQ